MAPAVSWASPADNLQVGLSRRRPPAPADRWTRGETGCERTSSAAAN